MTHYTMTRFQSRRTIFCLCAVLAGIICLSSGCKKKNQEPIDLGSTHTTAAETMASSNEADLTLEAAIENAVGTETGPQTGAVSGLKLNASIETYTQDSHSIQYPVMENLGDSSKTEAVNELLKENAVSILNSSNFTKADTITVTCEVVSADLSRITAIYKGSLTSAQAAHPTNFFYSSTIDVRNVSNIKLSQFADPSVLADYVRSEECHFYEASPELATALSDEVSSQSRDYYLNLFRNADFPVENGFPSCFSYEFEGDIYVSIPVSHALGDYTLVVFTPENK